MVRAPRDCFVTCVPRNDNLRNDSVWSIPRAPDPTDCPAGPGQRDGQHRAHRRGGAHARAWPAGDRRQSARRRADDRLEIAARAAPDGYTLAVAPIGAVAISPHVVAKAPYDPRKDIQPIALATTNQMLLASSVKTPFKTVRDIVDHAKQNPGKLTNGSSGNGTPGPVGMELFKAMTGAQIVHIPYKGGAAAIGDLMAGQIQLMMESLNSITPHAKAQRVRAIGVTGARRSDALPHVPTIAEGGGPGYEATTWTGIVGPVGMPKALVARLNARID